MYINIYIYTYICMSGGSFASIWFLMQGESDYCARYLMIYIYIYMHIYICVSISRGALLIAYGVLCGVDKTSTLDI